MEERKRVLDLRHRLDRTLALPDLADEASLRALVKKQILASALPGTSDQVLGDIDLIAEARAKEVSEFLEMLNTSCDGRTVHEAPQKEWKVKQDTDQLRVMYREGPEGPRFIPFFLKALLMVPLMFVHVCHGKRVYTENGFHNTTCPLLKLTSLAA
jgi:hypothetical protein